MKEVIMQKQLLVENIACKYLKGNKYIIIEKDFKYKNRIIDLIAYDNETKELVFIKLKNCSNLKEFNIRNRIREQEKLKRLAKSYNCDYGLYDIPVRFDMIKVFLTNSIYKIKHKKQIFI